MPHSALHDIDANKPGGSIKIRVKTYVHSLKLHEERLEDVARKKLELSRRIDEKRLELLRMKHAQLASARAATRRCKRRSTRSVAKADAYQRQRE